MKFTGNDMRVCALFGYGQKQMKVQTMRRCDKAAELYSANSVQKIYITGVLGEQMKRYLTGRGIPTGDIITQPRGLTTAGEIKLFSQLITRGISVMGVSSWYHLPRIWLISRAFKKKMMLIASYGGVLPTDLLRELPLLLFALIRPQSFVKIAEK